MVLVLPEIEEERRIYRCDTPGGAHMDLKISPTSTDRQTRKKESQRGRHSELPNNILKELVLSKMTDSECFVMHIGNMPAEFQI